MAALALAAPRADPAIRAIRHHTGMATIQPDRRRAVAPDGEPIHQRRPWPRTQTARRFRGHDDRRLAATIRMRRAAHQHRRLRARPTGRSRHASLSAPTPRRPPPALRRHIALGCSAAQYCSHASRVNFDAPGRLLQIHGLPDPHPDQPRIATTPADPVVAPAAATAGRMRSPARRAAATGCATAQARPSRCGDCQPPGRHVRHSRTSPPASAAVVRATHRIASAPQPIGTNASHSSPNGISSSAISPAGITQSAVSGTATMFASTK